MRDCRRLKTDADIHGIEGTIVFGPSTRPEASYSDCQIFTLPKEKCAVRYTILMHLQSF